MSLGTPTAQVVYNLMVNNKTFPLPSTYAVQIHTQVAEMETGLKEHYLVPLVFTVKNPNPSLSVSPSPNPLPLSLSFSLPPPPSPLPLSLFLTLLALSLSLFLTLLTLSLSLSTLSSRLFYSPYTAHTM